MAKAFRSLFVRRSSRQPLQEPPSPKREESFELVDRCPDIRWKRTLKANHPNLRSEIRVNDVLPRFHSFLTDVEYLRVQGSDKADNVDQVDQLFRILLTKEKRDFEEFLVALWQQGYADSAARLAEEAGVVLNNSSGMAMAVDRDVALATRAGIPKSQKHAMKEKGMLYYPLIESLHDAFYEEVIIPFEAFVMKSTDADFRHLRRVCVQVIRREEHPIACKVHLPTQREEFLDDLECKHGLWKDVLEYQLLREVIMAFNDEGLTPRLKQYEALLHKEGNTILMQCQCEFRRCPDLCLKLKADHNTALATLRRLKSFLVNDVGLADASFAGFREGCIELFFRISSESASTALDPLCSHAFRSKLLSMGVRRVTLSGHWVIDTNTGHVVFLQSPESLTDHDPEDSTADVTPPTEMTASITGHSGRRSDLEDVPSCKRVKLNPEEEDAPVFQPSHNIEWQAAAEFQPYHKVERQAAEGDSSLLQSESSRSCVADKGTSDDEETMEDGMCQPTKVAASYISNLDIDWVPEEERSPTLKETAERLQKVLEELYREWLEEEEEEEEEERRRKVQEEEEAKRHRKVLWSPLMWSRSAMFLEEQQLLKRGRLVSDLSFLDKFYGKVQEEEEAKRHRKVLWSPLLWSRSAMFLEEQQLLKVQLHAARSVGSAKCSAARRKRRCRSTLPNVELTNEAVALKDSYSAGPCLNLGVDESLVMSVSNFSQCNSKQLRNTSVENIAPTPEVSMDVLFVNKHGSTEGVDNEGDKQSLTLEDEGSCTLRMQQSAGSQDVIFHEDNTQVGSDAQSEDNLS